MNGNSKLSRSIFALVAVLGIMASTTASRAVRPDLVGPVTIYVDADAAGANDGTSWANAYTHLQDALDQVDTQGNPMYDIWVAEGVYYPDEESLGSEHTDGSQSESFTISHDMVRLYGGFAGTESILDERDPDANLTILSGDIDQNDTNLDGNFIAEDWTDVVGSNAYHVLVLDGTTFDVITSAVEIDGFVITAGDATDITHYGGGIYCYADGASSYCHPVLRNLRVQGNLAFIGGGIMLYADFGGKSNPEMTNVSIIGNKASDNGGGMYVFVANDPNSEGSPTMVNVRFHHNYSGDDGGGFGIATSQGVSSLSFSNVEFCSNVAEGDGGGLSIMSSTAGTVLSHLVNLSVFGNQAYMGGGIKTYQYAGSAFSMDIVNTAVWGNTATNMRPEIYNYGSTPLVYYSDIKDCGGSGTGWDSLYCGTDGGDNIDADPLFREGPDCDLSLLAGSPAIDAGDQTALPLDITDLDGDGNFAETLPDDLLFNPRVVGGEVDMGAYEYIPMENDNVGFYVPGNYRWYLKTGVEDGWAGVISFGWGGVSELMPVVGDWDGDGVDTAAFYKPSQWRWYIKNDHNDGWSGVSTFQWGGNAEMIPIAGDWDGDGDDTVGFYKPAASEWYLKDDNTGGWTGFTKVIWGGAAGNIPIAGDWDGDGDDTIGFYVPSQNKWWLKNDLADGWTSVTGVNFGTADPMDPVAGDWDGDGDSTMGGYVPAKWSWFLKDDQVDGWSNVTQIHFGVIADYEVLAGDWQ